ncbi:J domain-containing protein [Paenibacillus pinistramenti]|uniref:J domain-containing protein n=1 Tax=Paenibacillus pinistramenti TaxID=1768003 RepID=UPI001109AA01|nr:extracellular solute-binding protein [Paenibacillus pinistramenti]
MDELRNAYETLGLEEGAPREEVNKKYDLYVRKFRSRGRTADPDAEDPFEKINQAYRYIINYEDSQVIDQKRQERFGKWGRFAGQAEQLDDFLRLHRTKILVSLIAAVVLIIGISMYVSHRQEQERLAKLPPADLSVMFVGNFVLPEGDDSNEALEQSLLAPFSDWKRITAKVSYFPGDGVSSGQMGMALQQKAQIDVMTEKPDLYIMDKSSFAWLAQGGALQNLDSYADGELKSLLSSDEVVKESTEEDTSSHIYGIDLSNSSLASSLAIGKTDMIVGIRGGTELSGNTLKFIKSYLEAEQAK